MRKLLLIVLALASLAHGANKSAVVPPRCVDALTPLCQPTKKDLRDAKREYEVGLKLAAAGQSKAAYDKFQHAAALVPQLPQYVTSREIVKQKLVLDNIKRGTDLLAENKRDAALAQFHEALAVDPSNDFAMQRVRNAVDTLGVPTRLATVVDDSPEMRLQPEPGKKDFHYRGDNRGLLETVAHAFGIEAVIDDSVLTKTVRFDIDAADFATAMNAARQATKTMYSPLSAKAALFTMDTQQNHQLYDRMSLRTLYVPDATSPQELNDVVNVLRILFDVRFITQQPASSTVTLRAPTSTMTAISRFLDGLELGRPQLMLDMKVFEVSSSLLRQIGSDLPLQYTLFNVPTEARSILGGRSVQDVINQLIASGAINQANSTGIAALIAQQTGSGQNSVLNQPFATFGGGITLMGLTLPGSTFHLNLNESTLRNLEHVNVRASQTNPAILKIGTRYPIVNATFAPIFNSSAISKVIGNQTFIPPLPSVTYEDLGVNLKATPRIHRGNEITLDVQLQVRSLGADELNGVPVISNREYNGMITLKNGEAGVVAGTITNSEQHSVQGLPLVSTIPVIGRAASFSNVNDTRDELLIVITPHILVNPAAAENASIPVPTTGAR